MTSRMTAFFGILILMIPVSLHAEETKYNFGDHKSSTLSTKAWAALEVSDWKGVEAYTEKCISLYSKKALQQQAELTSMPPAAVAFNYWALNDVGTCYFIKAKALKEQGKYDMAKKVCQLVIDEYSYAQCWDPQGWFWSVAAACKDLITMLGTHIDFEDYTSETLTRKAWESLGSNNITNTIIYANKCISLYKKDAVKQQESLSNYAPKEKAFDYWALNDVGTCYFILGEAYAKNKEWKKAVEAYQTVVNEFFYAQCWDPRGWFWKPAVASRGKLNKIIAEQGIS
jgi:tetratricopeptide (TPR) repeat protein